MLLLDKDLKVLVDDGDGQQDTSSAANSSEQIGRNRESTNTETSKGGGSGDDTLQFFVHASLTMASHNQLLILQLLGNILGRRSGDFNPGLGEQGASGQHKRNVHDKVERISERGGEIRGRRDEVSETGSGKFLRNALKNKKDLYKTEKNYLRETSKHRAA